MDTPPVSRAPIMVKWTLMLGAALASGALVAWAITTTVLPVEDPLAASDFTHVEVTEGEVGSELNLTALAEWKLSPVGVNRANGVVTTVDVRAGENVSQGDTLFSVDLSPVVIAQGDVPSFRRIEEASTGPDVAQLQRMLADLGFYNYAIDGTVGVHTVEAIRAWQESLGKEDTGAVEAGDVIFVPHLPARIALDTQIIARGASLAGGEKVVNVLADAPGFRIPVTESQARMMPEGTRVELTAPDESIWAAITADQVSDGESQIIDVSIVAPQEGPLCGEECDLVPTQGQTELRAKVVVLETVAGAVVPTASIMTTAEGDTVVITEGGERIHVRIVASARGMSVIDGLSLGIRVRLPATEVGGP